MGLRRWSRVHRTESPARVQNPAGVHRYPRGGGSRRQIAARRRMGRLGKIGRLTGHNMISLKLPVCTLLMCSLALVARAQSKPADPAVPHLEKRGQATQLIVDGKPFLALAGELSNTVSSDTDRMKAVWPVLANKVHMNTVLTGVSWDWIEPEEGKYDFHLVDQLIADAQRNNVRIVWLWFASWKNGLSSFAPAWVKAAQDRFPRAQIRGGKTIEVLSALSRNNLQADARAFAALMRHTR